MNAIPYDRPEEEWDSYEEGTQELALPGRPRRQWFNKTSAAVFAVLLGVWELHQDKMATRELLWQYRNQLVHFARARLELVRFTTQAHRHEVLIGLGKDSLMECYLWTIHRYHREHEPPAAG